MSNHADSFTLSELENIISSLSQVDPTNAAIRGQSSRPKVIRVWLPKTIDFSDADQKWQLVIIQTRLIITRLFGKFTQLPEEWVPNKRALH